MRASVVTRALAIEGVDLVMWLERDAHEAPREGGHREPRPRRAALRPRAARLQDPRGRRWSVEGPARRCSAGAPQDGRAADARLPGRARARVVGAHLPHLRRGAAVGGAGLRVHRLGPPGARRRRQPRLAARQRLARRAALLRRWRCPSASPPSGRSATSRRSCSSTSAWPSRVALASTRSATPAAGSALRRARAGPARRRASRLGDGQTGPGESPIQVALSSTPLPGRTLSARRALAIASALAKVREARRGHKGSYGGRLHRRARCAGR